MLKRKLTPEEKQQIYSLHNQGLTVAEIADQMHIDNPQQVAGVVRAGINFRKIPSRQQLSQNSERPMTAPIPTPIPAPAPLQPIQMSGPSAVLEAPPQAYAAPAYTPPAPVYEAPAPPVSRPVHLARERIAAPPPEAAAGDGFTGWTQAAAFTGGFNNAALNIRYVVYRDEPADGLIGEHTSPFSETDLAKAYGRGLYRIQRFDPGNPRPFQVSVKIAGGAFGEPRFPQREGAASQRPGYSRWGQGRPWMRPPVDQTPEDEGRPMERPSLYDYSRHAPTNSDATTEAIKQIGNMSLRSMELGEQSRRQGPDSFVTKFFGEQQNLWQKQLEENRRNDEQRRHDEEDKWERRQKEAEAEHKRRQEDEERRHDRELTKIKAEADARAKAAESERKMLLDLEGAKLKVIEEQNKLRQEALQEELKRNRDEQREQQIRLEKQLADMQNATEAQISENQARIEKELTREREALEREHKLREKGQDKEHELNTKILDIKQTALEAQGTNEIFQVVNNVINKFSSGLNQVIELKKLEATTPEAQVAAATKGNIYGATSEHRETEAAAEPNRAQQAAAAAAAKPEASANGNGKNGNGNGHAAASTGEAQGEVNMEEMIRNMLDKPFFKEVIEEWGTHVRTKQDGTTFLNMYREWMCDPNDHDGRKATTMFANFVAPRDWDEFYAIIKPKLDKKTIAIFDTEHARTFYETFRSLITEQIRAFWEEFAQQREAVNAGRRAAGIDKEKEAVQK